MKPSIECVESSTETIAEPQWLVAPPLTPTPAPKPFDLAKLTSRQLDVLRLLAGGSSLRQMAEAMSISVNTLKDHLTALMKKAGASNRCHLAAIFAAQSKDHPPWPPHK